MADVRIRVLTPELAAAQYATKGSVTAITKAALGLGNVDNTADSAKPLSAAAVAALALKADAAATTTALAGKADGAATTTALGLKADASNVYTKTQVDDKVAAGGGGSAGTAEAPIQRVIRQRADGTYPDRPDRSVLYTYDWQGNPAAPVSATKALAGVDTILLTDTVVA